jgi:hypothetical protein
MSCKVISVDGSNFASLEGTQDIGCSHCTEHSSVVVNVEKLQPICKPQERRAASRLGFASWGNSRAAEQVRDAQALQPGARTGYGQGICQGATAGSPGISRRSSRDHQGSEIASAGACQQEFLRTEPGCEGTCAWGARRTPFHSKPSRIATGPRLRGSGWRPGCWSGRASPRPARRCRAGW